MIPLSLRPRAASRHRDDRAGRLSAPALLGVALLIVATAPALAASHGGHSGGGGHSSSGGGHASSSGGGHAGGGHPGGGMRTMSSGPAMGGGSHGGGSHNGWHGAVGHNGGRGFHDGFHDGFHGGFHGGRFFNSPRFFFPRFGFYGALGFTWGTPFFWGFPYDYWPYYYPYYYGWDGPGPYYGYDRLRREEQGALDLDLSPADTQVFVDGQLVGKVDDFDGWPQYLWLDPGTYDIVFYREGYKTLARQVTIYRGLVIDWNDRLEQGPSTRPEELQTKTHDRRDARLQQDREMQERAERDGYYRRRDDGDWRDRADRDRDGYRDDDERPPAREPRHLGRMRLEVTPGDASVYLDGRFVGTAEEVAQSGGLTVGAGDHTLSVVRPGRHSQERHFTVKAGEDTTLSFDLHNE